MYVCNGTRITSNNICRAASGILNIFVWEEDNTKSHVYFSKQDSTTGSGLQLE